MQYAGIHPGGEPDFFGNYYTPIWSIIYWLSHEEHLPIERLNTEDVASAVTAQSMAMFIHSLDDHLTDGQVFRFPDDIALKEPGLEHHEPGVRYFGCGRAEW